MVSSKKRNYNGKTHRQYFPRKIVKLPREVIALRLQKRREAKEKREDAINRLELAMREMVNREAQENDIDANDLWLGLGRLGGESKKTVGANPFNGFTSQTADEYNAAVIKTYQKEMITWNELTEEERADTPEPKKPLLWTSVSVARDKEQVTRYHAASVEQKEEWREYAQKSRERVSQKKTDVTEASHDIAAVQRGLLKTVFNAETRTGQNFIILSVKSNPKLASVMPWLYVSPGLNHAFKTETRPGILNISLDDFMTKGETLAIGGMSAVASMELQEIVSRKPSTVPELRKNVTDALHKSALVANKGKPVSMNWVNFTQCIEASRGLGIKGWPSEIPRESTNNMKKFELEKLHQGLSDGTITFYELSKEEREQAQEKVRMVMESEAAAEELENVSIRKRKPVAEASLRNLKKKSRKGSVPSTTSAPGTTTPSLNIATPNPVESTSPVLHPSHLRSQGVPSNIGSFGDGHQEGSMFNISQSAGGRVTGSGMMPNPDGIQDGIDIWDDMDQFNTVSLALNNPPIANTVDPVNHFDLSPELASGVPPMDATYASLAGGQLDLRAQIQGVTVHSGIDSGSNPMDLLNEFGPSYMATPNAQSSLADFYLDPNAQYWSANNTTIGYPTTTIPSYLPTQEVPSTGGHVQDAHASVPANFAF